MRLSFSSGFNPEFSVRVLNKIEYELLTFPSTLSITSSKERTFVCSCVFILNQTILVSFHIVRETTNIV